MPTIPKTILALTVLLGLSFICFPKPKFKLLEATSQHWTAGMAGGGSGTDYAFKVVIQTTAKIKFDSVWLNGKAFLIQAVKGKQFNPLSEFEKNDTITLKISDLVHGRKPGESNTPNTELNKAKATPPVPYKGDALIRYTIANKKHYYSVAQIKKQQPVNLP